MNTFSFQPKRETSFWITTLCALDGDFYGNLTRTTNYFIREWTITQLQAIVWFDSHDLHTKSIIEDMKSVVDRPIVNFDVSGSFR